MFKQIYSNQTFRERWGEKTADYRNVDLKHLDTKAYGGDFGILSIDINNAVSRENSLTYDYLEIRFREGSTSVAVIQEDGNISISDRDLSYSASAKIKMIDTRKYDGDLVSFDVVEELDANGKYEIRLRNIIYKGEQISSVSAIEKMLALY